MKQMTCIARGKFWALDGQPREVEVEGYRFEVHGLAFCVHKTDPFGKSHEGFWSVTEPITGSAVVDHACETRSEALAAGRRRLEQAGPDETIKAILKMARRMLKAQVKEEEEKTNA